MRGILISFCAALVALSGCVQSEKETGDDQSLTAAQSDNGEQQDSVLRGFDAGPTDTEVGKLPDKPKEEDIVQAAPDSVDNGSDAVVVEDSGPEVDVQTEPDTPVADADAQDAGIDGGSDTFIEPDALADAADVVEIDIADVSSLDTVGSDSDTGAVDSGTDAQVEPDTADSGPDTQVVGTDATVVASDLGPDMVDSGSSDAGTVDSGSDGSDTVDAGADAQDVQPDVPAVDLCANVNCNDGNLCTADSCNPTTGACVFSNNTLVCEDGDLCTAGETCTNGACVAGPVIQCSDSNPCTADSCNKSAGCIHVNVAAACEDGNPCTVGDVCNAGACTAGSAKTCDDGDACTSNVCDASGACVNAKNYVVYDWKDGKVPPNWTVSGGMQVACELMLDFGQQCVMWVPQEGAPAWSVSTGELDLKTVRALKNMGNGDISITFKWARFQWEANNDTMTTKVLDAADKAMVSASLVGQTGVVVTEKFVVGPAGVKFRFQEVLNQYSLKGGPAVLGTTTVAPIGCIPPPQ